MPRSNHEREDSLSQLTKWQNGETRSFPTRTSEDIPRFSLRNDYGLFSTHVGAQYWIFVPEIYQMEMRDNKTPVYAKKN